MASKDSEAHEDRNDAYNIVTIKTNTFYGIKYTYDTKKLYTNMHVHVYMCVPNIFI